MEEETIYQGWLEFCVDTSNAKSWMRFPVKKPWKRKYFVLYHLSEDADRVFLASYDKDENWHAVEPRKVLDLYPRYKIAKISNFKGRENVLEVNNEKEQWYLTNEKPKIIDLWATQIQMQTKLSRAISGRIFSVSGAVNKQMQRIGAAQQRCLLHFTRWGITLALQDSRAILSMWPLKSIRNYESSQQCQFSLEAGRRSPMGEGVYIFNTNIGQDEEMFNVVDAFVAATLNENAQLNPKQREPTTDEEILRTYDQLHRSATGLDCNATHQLKSNIDTPGYAQINREISKSNHSNDSICIYKPPDYNHLYNDRESSRRNTGESISPVAGFHAHFGTPRGLSFSDNNSYDQLDRKESWGSRSEADVKYDHIHQKIETRLTDTKNPYDKIDFPQQVTPGAQDIPRHNFAGHLLQDEPSVPFLHDDQKPFQGRSGLSVSLMHTPDDEKYEFRNSIYNLSRDTKTDFRFSDNFSPLSVQLNCDSTASSSMNLSSRHGSVTSESEGVGFSRTKQRASCSIKDKNIQDIADHFLYQMPSAFSPQMNSDLQEERNEDDDIEYQNTESVRHST